ncbi:hypothetical protein B0T25DRAFT_566516 [Lasiosphaeria hispida]|uniref:RRM domain-containing protein n=1 Tax=Lasiosphaeria hispida TaxID=260671 RepID=A0AAJ0MFY1_9PEZI|nr:hypothetical protein B0T25DRAFT_566516 [Lasiosphaeria hispida]
MAPASASTVTIDRSYFDLLLRSLKVVSFEDKESPPIIISQDEHTRLTLIAKKYENLRRNLLGGGVGDDTLDLLSQDDKANQNGSPDLLSKVEMTEDGGVALDSITKSAHVKPKSTTLPQSNGGYHQHSSHGGGYCNDNSQGWANGDGEEDDEDGSCDADSPVEGGPVGANYAKPQAQRQQFDRQCTRTVQLSNLPEGCTHADITKVVRGGMLLDIFLRTHERSATVSFLHAVEARRFFDHVRKHDLYIKNKRAEIKWSDRQFILPGHVAGKVAMGASRNLVIRRYDGRHTEENIRDDLDHIHNCIVVKVEFIGGSCYVNLNSVHNAIYARMCMMSRAKYKGTKIEWDVDECAQPYAPALAVKPRKEAPAPKKAPITNRFQLLNLDDQSEDEIAAPFQPKKPLGIAA